ncbi:iron complex transport system ATP-binding protein [Nocardiopsis sp. Huas11]|uniref:ABC transporter ATP-binding protein n=1 Tax=Nocardiopsis sp. Huas11 TaxID=2183912 RepID=UPI000EB2CDE2|nr:ABC transporter ATP-binding protein [Nocardiopsis sp. Huas11]RKS05965.1 iron complex transport system ATP-binding protein [Nocardiopsis sp. Huas11]
MTDTPADSTAATAGGTPAPGTGLSGRSLRVAYDDRVVLEDVDVDVPPGRTTVIVGANACGKSTLLRTLSRLISPRSGSVLLDGESVHRMRTRDLARRLGILPQSPTAPEGMTVLELVTRGRSPHQSMWRQWSASDSAAVRLALTATGLTDLADRPVDQLSGGQRQRAWIAMSLAQDTPTLLLDEPTTFLDLAHQIEVLDLIADLNHAGDRTVVMVLHDLNHAGRYADHIIAMKDGAIVAEGPPGEVITTDLVADVFGLRCEVISDPLSGTPLVVPFGRHRCADSA